MQIELSVLAGYRSLTLGQHTEQYISVSSYKQERVHYQFDQQGGYMLMLSILLRSQPERSPVSIMLQLSGWWSSKSGKGVFPFLFKAFPDLLLF